MTTKQKILDLLEQLPDDVTFEQVIDRLDALRVVDCPPPEGERYPLRGTVARYDDPLEPAVPAEEWESTS